MMGRYILDGHTPVRCDDIMAWTQWFEQGDDVRRVGLDENDGGVRVSTVFLGLDHGFGRGEPVLFETMVFGGSHDGDQKRYATWDEAVAGHHAKLIKVGIPASACAQRRQENVL